MERRISGVRSQMGNKKHLVGVYPSDNAIQTSTHCFASVHYERITVSQNHGLDLVEIRKIRVAGIERLTLVVCDGSCEMDGVRVRQLPFT